MQSFTRIAQVALAAVLLVAAVSAQPPKPGPGFRNFINNLSKVVAAEGSQFLKAPPATVETVVCGESTLAVFVQVIGSSCNVTTVQTTDAGRSKQGPRACSAGEIFPGKACTAMPGALTITVAPGADQKGLVKTEGEPDLQGSLSLLGIGGLQEVGSLRTDVLFGQYVHESKLAILPSLQRITGVPGASASATGIQQPTVSQLSINGGLGSPLNHSFASVSFQPTSINGQLQITATALNSLDSFAGLQAVAGDVIVNNNNDLTALFTSNIVKLQVMSNPQLTSFKGLDALQQLGGGLLVVNNSALVSMDGLGALGALNATGAASVSLPKALGLDAIKLTAPSVLVTGNGALADVSALARLAGCASGSPSGTTGIVLEVHPAGQALKCTLVAWQQVCDYIAAGNKVPADSLWRNNGVCISS
ncbi:hypothetical protein WJX81_002040 [Elliptochloris bilobata]|uniref:Receptor L-domain domain-containing protein n=1 Tax=Elliptochloris bilobata TaxID=381761 RepID=A0AAW1SKG2_9CHLO